MKSSVAKFTYVRCILFLFCVALVAALGGATAAKVKLTIAHAWPEEVLQRQQVFDESFMKAHPDIELVVENHPWGQMNEKMKVRAASGTMPDIVYVHPNWAAEWYDYFLDLDQFAKTDPDIRMSDIIPTALYRDQKNVLKGIGYDSSPTMLFFRRDFFDNAGLAYPDKSWTYTGQFKEAARKLTVRDSAGVITRHGARVNVNNGGWQLEGVYLRPFGAYLARETENGIELLIDQPVAIKAVEWWVELVTKDEIAQFGGDFAQGQLGMAFDGPWFRRYVDPRLIDYDIAHMPAGPVTRITPASGSFYAITSTCKHPKEAWEYLKAYTGTENQRYMWASVGDALPSRKSAWDAFLRAAQQGDYVQNAARILEAMSEYAVGHAMFLGINDIYKVYNDEFNLRYRSEPVASILQIIAQKARAVLGDKAAPVR
jgi:multiple sugar transport system substrate-binding protein